MFCPFSTQHRDCEACGIYNHTSKECTIKSIAANLAVIAANMTPNSPWQTPAPVLWPTDTEYGRKINIIRMLPKGCLIDIGRRPDDDGPFQYSKANLLAVTENHIVIKDIDGNEITLEADDYDYHWCIRTYDD